jgi:hypothetical protein
VCGPSAKEGDFGKRLRGGYVDLEDPRLIRRRELAELLYYLNDTESQGVLLLGTAGTGKTTLLHMAQEELKKQRRAVFFVGFRGLRDAGELGARVLDAVAASSVKDADNIGRTLRTSAGAPPLQEAAAILRHADAWMQSAVLLFDALDESADPLRMAAAVEELSLALDHCKLVVSSRPTAVAEIRRFGHFRVLQLAGVNDKDAAALLRGYSPGLSDAAIPRIVELAHGNPLYLQLVVRELEYSDPVAATTDILSSLEDALERMVNEAVSSSSDPAKLGGLLEELALAGGRD